MFGMSGTEMIIILVLALLLLGPEKLPEMAKLFGKGMREFQKATDDIKNTVEGEFYAMGKEIEVRDEGPGVPIDALGHLFEKFYRADDGDRRRAGTGLGLAIAKGFVEAQGGAIGVRNRADRSGAVFTLSYPVPT